MLRSERKQATRHAIIDAALKLSAERGFSSLSLRSVAKKAGIAPTSFYRHFADMDELGLEPVTRRYRDHEPVLVALTDGEVLERIAGFDGHRERLRNAGATHQRRAA